MRNTPEKDRKGQPTQELRNQTSLIFSLYFRYYSVETNHLIINSNCSRFNWNSGILEEWKYGVLNK